MAQHDYTIANQGFPAFRSDLNDALAAIVSNNSGATEPTTMFAHQIWVDTAANPSILKIRNADNDAWITIGSIDQTGDTFTLTSAVSATTLNTSGAVVFNDAGADVDFRVEGDTDANLLFVDASADKVGVGTSSPSYKLDVVSTSMRIASGTTGVGYVQYGNSATASQNWHVGTEGDGTYRFYNGNFGSGTERMRVTSGGDLNFNSGYGSVATAFGCRAWVNFDGTGTIAIRSSGNVSSLTDNGIGYYSVNFTTAMPDANYSTVANSSDAFPNVGTGVSLDTVTTSAFRLVNINVTSQTYFDSVVVCASVFR